MSLHHGLPDENAILEGDVLQAHQVGTGGIDGNATKILSGQFTVLLDEHIDDLSASLTKSYEKYSHEVYTVQQTCWYIVYLYQTFISYGQKLSSDGVFPSGKRQISMKICVIGGGLCGLVAADRLAGQCEVDVLERNPVLGGCLGSFGHDGYRLENFYHHCFPGDTEFLSLLGMLGLTSSLRWLNGSTGSFENGRVYPLTTAGEILRYPALSVIEKARLALLTLRAGSTDIAPLDRISATEYIKANLGDHIYREFFEPLLRSKFGESRNEVSAAWLISRIAIRSHRGAAGERLGYPEGGFARVVEGLETRIRAAGGTIRPATPVTSVRRGNGRWEINGTPYDAVISTIPPHALATLGGPEAPPIPYQGACCLALGLDREVTGGVYWVNLKDPAPYGAVIAHTNFAPRTWYGEDIVYLASYFSGCPAPDIGERMLADFRTRFRVLPKEIRWTHLSTECLAGPVYVRGYREHIPPYGGDGLYFAGMFSAPNYPERSMEGSVRAGTIVAGEILAHGG
jgi:protoporphyrinogen oxidase